MYNEVRGSCVEETQLEWFVVFSIGLTVTSIDTTKQRC